MRICGKANEVFKAIKNISQRSPDMTAKDALQRGLMSPDLQYTKTYELGKYPSVYINEEYAKN